MAARKKLDLLTAVEQIVEKAKGTGLSSDFYRKADKYINSDDTSITISDFGKFLDCRTTRIIRYMQEIDVLEKRELIRCSRDGNRITYRVPLEVVEAFNTSPKTALAFHVRSCSER